MIIVGTRGITYSAGQGTFSCPSCSSFRQYKKKRVRRFFTLYFIPIIPLDLIGEYVECSACESTWKTDILDYEPAQPRRNIEAEYQLAVRRVMVLMTLSDGLIQDEELDEIGRIYEIIGKTRIEREAIRKEATEALRAGESVEEYLSAVASYLNEAGKENIIRAAFMVAAADGTFHEAEKALLGRIGTSLGMSRSHLNGVINDLISSDDDDHRPAPKEPPPPERPQA
jgi:tellurite resistance protein